MVLQKNESSEVDGTKSQTRKYLEGWDSVATVTTEGDQEE